MQPSALVEEQVDGDQQLKLREERKTVYPRKWNEEMTTSWINDLGVLSPNEQRRMLRGRFNGKNLIGNTLIKPLTEDVIHHKAMGVIQFWTPAEFTATMAKADITGNVPEFEDAVQDADTLYDLFTTQTFEAVVGDYFTGDGHPLLAKQLWADLTRIDDASRARDARRIFKILAPHLKDLRRRQQGFDLVDKATGRNEEVGKGGEGGEHKEHAAGTAGGVISVFVKKLVRAISPNSARRFLLAPLPISPSHLVTYQDPIDSLISPSTFLFLQSCALSQFCAQLFQTAVS